MRLRRGPDLLEPTVASVDAESTKLRLATLLMSLNQSGDLGMDELVDAALRTLQGARSSALTPVVASFSRSSQMSAAELVDAAPV